jgi:hypothetical protein
MEELARIAIKELKDGTVKPHPMCKGFESLLERYKGEPDIIMTFSLPNRLRVKYPPEISRDGTIFVNRDCINEIVKSNRLNFCVVDFSLEIEKIEYGMFNNSVISEVDLSTYTNIKEIERMAFLNTEKLERVKFPPNLKLIGERAFCQSKIREVDLSNVNGPVEIGLCAFKDCAQLKKVTIPQGKIHPMAFSDCYISELIVGPDVNLEGVKLPSRCQVVRTEKIPEVMAKPVRKSCDAACVRGTAQDSSKTAFSTPRAETADKTAELTDLVSGLGA